MSDKNIIQLLIEKFENKSEVADKQPKKIKPVRIRMKLTGQWLLTGSNKTIWKRKGDAANALNLHVNNLLCSLFIWDYTGKYKGPDNKLYTSSEMKVMIDAAHVHIKKNCVDFVEVES